MLEELRLVLGLLGQTSFQNLAAVLEDAETSKLFLVFHLVEMTLNFLSLYIMLLAFLWTCSGKLIYGEYQGGPRS